MQHRIIHHRGAIHISGIHHIGDIAMHEDVTWVQVQEGCFGTPRVGTSYPEDLGVLGAREGRE